MLEGWKYDEDITSQYCPVDATNKWSWEDNGAKSKGKLWLDNLRKNESVSEVVIFVVLVFLRQEREQRERKREIINKR